MPVKKFNLDSIIEKVKEAYENGDYYITITKQVVGEDKDLKHTTYCNRISEEDRILTHKHFLERLDK